MTVDRSETGAPNLDLSVGLPSEDTARVGCHGIDGLLGSSNSACIKKVRTYIGKYIEYVHECI